MYAQETMIAYKGTSSLSNRSPLLYSVPLVAFITMTSSLIFHFSSILFTQPVLTCVTRFTWVLCPCYREHKSVGCSCSYNKPFIVQVWYNKCFVLHHEFFLETISHSSIVYSEFCFRLCHVSHSCCSPSRAFVSAWKQLSESLCGHTPAWLNNHMVCTRCWECGFDSQCKTCNTWNDNRWKKACKADQRRH